MLQVNIKKKKKNQIIYCFLVWILNNIRHKWIDSSEEGVQTTKTGKFIWVYITLLHNHLQKETPFKLTLTYEAEALMIPIEMMKPSPRRAMVVPETKSIVIQVNLDLIDEVRELV